MTQSDFYDRIFEYPQIDIAGLVFANPEDLAASAESRESAAWELLLGSMRLRRAGQLSAANDWLNHAAQMDVESEVFKAEFLGEAGKGLSASERFQDAFQILNSAAAVWRDVCEEAVRIRDNADLKRAVEFASELSPLFDGANAVTSASEMSSELHLVEQWLTDRAVIARARTINCFLRLISKMEQVDDARDILEEELEWIALHFTTSAKPLAALPIEERAISRPVRHGLYWLLLAKGEIELASGNYQASADGFGAVAKIYEGKVEDEYDVKRVLVAEFNKANSLLRLNRAEEAIGIYELCRHGFNSFDDAEFVQRIDHAILFARTLADDEDDDA